MGPCPSSPHPAPHCPTSSRPQTDGYPLSLQKAQEPGLCTAAGRGAAPWGRLHSFSVAMLLRPLPAAYRRSVLSCPAGSIGSSEGPRRARPSETPIQILPTTCQVHDFSLSQLPVPSIKWGDSNPLWRALGPRVGDKGPGYPPGAPAVVARCPRPSNSRHRPMGSSEKACTLILHSALGRPPEWQRGAGLCPPSGSWRPVGRQVPKMKTGGWVSDVQRKV